MHPTHNPKQKSLKKVLALVLALVLLAGLLLFANALVGNPISRLLVKRSANAYVAETYSGTDYKIDSVMYSFKDGHYHVDVSSPSSQDTYFVLEYRASGKLFRDSYEEQVLLKGNTARRIDEEYRTRCKAILEGGQFPYEVYMGGGDLLTALSPAPPEEDTPQEPGVPLSPLDQTMLVLDKTYDVSKLGASHGSVWLYVEVDPSEITAETAAEVLLTAKELLETANLPFFRIDLHLEPPRGEDGTPGGEPTLQIRNFPWSEIEPEGLAERVQTAADALTQYYSEMDQLKNAELAQAEQ